MFSIAGVQFRVSSEYPNIQEMENRLASIAFRFPWVEMVVFSELAPFGPAIQHAHTEVAKLEQVFQEMAAKYGVWLIPGSHFVVEKQGTSNMSIVINPQGEIVGRYRKQFPFLPYEQGVEAGSKFLVFDVPGIARFGLSICYDMWFPETSRTLVAMGAEVIIHPSLTNTIDRSVEHSIILATAATNQCYVFDVNGVGDGGYGRSMVAGPSGDTIYLSGEGEEIFPLPLDLDRVRWEREHGLLGLGQVLKSFRDRRTEFPVYANEKTEPSFLDSLGPIRVTAPRQLG
jgi:predicted amidohydrolase